MLLTLTTNTYRYQESRLETRDSRRVEFFMFVQWLSYVPLVPLPFPFSF